MSTLGQFVKGYLMRLKVFYDKGREYYMLFFGIIGIATLIGVWLPHLHQLALNMGFRISQGYLTLILMAIMLVGINLVLILIGWFTYYRDITQQEMVWRDIQHPSNRVSMISWTRSYKMLDKITEGIAKVMKEEDNKEFMEEWNQIKKDYPIKLKVGSRELIDFDKMTLDDLDSLIKKAKSVRK